MDKPKEITYGLPLETSRAMQEFEEASDVLQFNAGCLSERTLKEPSIGDPEIKIKNHVSNPNKNGSY